MLVAAAGTIGCGDQQSYMSEVEGSPDIGDGDESDDGDDSSTSTDGYQLEATTETNVETNLGGSVPFGVQLSDDDGEPADNEQLDFEIVESTGDDGVLLDATGVFTDDDGEASNRLTVGDEIGYIRVEASHDQVDQPVEFFVEVTTIPAGDLQVTIDYADEDLLEVSDLELAFWETRRLACGFIAPYSAPSEPFVGEDTMDTVDGEVLFEALQSDDDYTVAVTAHGPENQISAHGCVDEIEIEGDETTEVVVDLELLPLTPTGSYEAISVWDFTEALAAAGPVGAAIADVFQWLANPADMAAEYLLGLAVDWVCDEYGTLSYECGAAVAAEAEGSAEDMVADFIQDQIDSIGILSDFQEMADDLVAIVESMTIESILTVDNKALGEGELRGVDSWQAAHFEWNRLCENDNSSDCAEIRVGLGDNTSFGALEADWDGRLVDYDHLEIDPHDMVIPYGEFITHILRQYVIPLITGGEEDTLSGAFEYLLCDNIGGFSAWGIEIDDDTVQDFCTTTFSAVSTLANIYINSLEYDVGLAICG